MRVVLLSEPDQHSMESEKMDQTFRTRLKAGNLLQGTMVTLADPAVAEILADIGYDWLFIDGEHGPLETAELLNIVRAVDHRIACVIRVPTATESSIKKVLDLGAAGVIAPMVNSAEQARDIVNWARYSPQGSRGVGLARAHRYGQKFEEYVSTANEHVAVIVQAEHISSAACIEEIVQVEGVDAIQLGPYDLSASMGKMGQLDDPEVVAAIDRVLETCQRANMPVGWFGVSASAVQPYIERGCTLITSSVDAILLASAAKETLSTLKDPQSS
ncbi:2-keto-3-deoxy-L-rhamnonate aldolase [Thalassoglobus neptunius]|uniref:2-keto-3-deoxy-L-rhamnonate aldolase n=1 Tax=Thalassoglobus neptunius TaxID=1938619 RepID=A0A5C5X668_9PLAN|nr:aldolase/citrate lyase family protein [Thalassoglobus neptunius]TWT57502.1 2-keto-3-deoxy-L-rhamnonate aldolase [Thalassoglobus neptunius]